MSLALLGKRYLNNHWFSLRVDYLCIVESLKSHEGELLVFKVHEAHDSVSKRNNFDFLAARLGAEQVLDLGSLCGLAQAVNEQRLVDLHRLVRLSCRVHLRLVLRSFSELDESVDEFADVFLVAESYS